MNAASYRLSTPNEIERVVEPLVNYICAAEKPKTALFSALAALCRQVDATNGTASAHFRRFNENR